MTEIESHQPAYTNGNSSSTNGDHYKNADSGYGSQNSLPDFPRENDPTKEKSSNGNSKDAVFDEDDDIPWGQRVKKEKLKEPKPEPMDEDDDLLLKSSSEKKRDSSSSKKPKIEDDDDDDVPFIQTMAKDKAKKEKEDDDVPFVQIISKAKKETETEKKDKEKKKRKREESDNEEEYKPEKKKDKKSKSKGEESDSEDKKPKKQVKKEVKKENTTSVKRKKKEEEQEEVWEWWKDEPKSDNTIKWKTLQHKGPIFAPPYEPLPSHVKFFYDGKPMELTPACEEVAGFYARMIDHEYVTKEAFNNNFWRDWRKVMSVEEREKIIDLKKCNFAQIDAFYKEQSEKRKAMTKEEKEKIKIEKEAEAKLYGFAFIDGHKQKIGNFRIEPPGLFRGRGGHPKMGNLKRRVEPEDVIINCSKDSEVPEPPKGHKWKEVRYDNKVTWLCSWSENVLGLNKYIMLNPSSKIKGEKDYAKFETARKLKSRINNIRKVYRADWKNKEMRLRQRAVALYFIDKLALRAGNEKDTEEAADTVGCCSLRCEHIKLHEQLEGKDYVVEFDFLGKDSIRYYNKVPVEKPVFKNLKLFMENKAGADDLFDRLDTSTLNQHLSSLMDGLTVKVFRTYNASITLQEQLDELTNPKENTHQKLLSYNRANRQVAILCNHQRAVPKTHEKSMENLENKIKDKKKELKQAKTDLEKAREAEKEKVKKRVDRLKDQYKRLKINHTDKDENKQIALGTSKLNYLDPRISVAWCKKHEVPIEKVFNKTQREKFRWALDMADEEYVF
ncbi:unnamed protein product, partial [Mesorhabditis belari]|uniref:DNA topoisomerase I n=1 Tax=Mesorhabditis belari TaxID=2138241 RepID=A0AAF3J7S0_9BILA